MSNFDIDPNALIFGPQDWEKYHHQKIPAKRLVDIDWSYVKKDNLDAPLLNSGKKKRESCFFALGLDKFDGNDLDILKWLEIHPQGSQHPRFWLPDGETWLRSQVFAGGRTCKFKWYEVILEPPPAGTSEVQLKTRYPGYDAMSPIEAVTMDLLFRMKFGQYLSVKKPTATKELSNGRRVCVQGTDDWNEPGDGQGGLNVYPFEKAVSA